MALKPLSAKTIDESALKADRKKCRKYDQCGLGELAIYMGSKMLPRKLYVPYEAVTHVYKRVAVSPGSGKWFLTPILYIVVRCDDGKEYQCSFRYLNEADDMLTQLEQTHPEICLMSPEGQKKLAAKEAREKALREKTLRPEAEHTRRDLTNAQRMLDARPKLCARLASASRIKRAQSLITTRARAICLVMFLAGILMVIGGMQVIRTDGRRVLGLVLALIGIADLFVMINSKFFPMPGRGKKKAEREYEAACREMEHYLAGYDDFPVPVRYCHPYVLSRMITIVEQERADTPRQALEVLKEDLKKVNSETSVDEKDYREIVTIKPMFLLNDYQ